MFLLLKMVIMILILKKETKANSSADFVTSYKKYHEICIGMGYQDQSCQQRERGAPIAFHALMSKQLTSLGNNVPVVFGKITLNAGNAYDPTSGKFTAPTDGIYFFTWTVLTGKGKLFNTEIVLNEKIVGYNYANGSQNGIYETGSSAAVIKMKKGDKAWIRTYSSHGQSVHPNWSSFSGFQL